MFALDVFATVFVFIARIWGEKRRR